MDIDERDIEKGSLPVILPGFHPNSISYLSELNDYRMYAEVWSNKKSEAHAKRMEIGHSGYLKTLEFGEQKKKRKSDKIRFDYFVVADSLNYKVTRTIYGELKAYIQIGRVQTNTIFNNIIKAKTRFLKTQSILPGSDFHSEGYLPEIIEIDLGELGLFQEEKTNKYYFEISTNVNDISNQYQKKLLLQILGRDDVFEKMHLLHKVGRKQIRCLFENPENVTRNLGASNAIPRLCVAWPFHETLVFDFAGVPEDYGDACLLGTLITTKEKIVKTPEVPAKDTRWLDGPQLDSFA
jgi:hypothetical protein